jgi:hypothetical protein
MPTIELAQEYPPPGEAEHIASLERRLQDKITNQYRNGLMRRDAHPKMHGLVKAEFIVEPDLPAAYRVGVFAEPQTYQAWIRYSNQNADIQSDQVNDIRGMAIKLMGVPGKKLLEATQDATTHDFIVISTNVFVTRDVAQFDALVRAMMGGKLSTAWFFLTHWRVSWNLFTAMRRCVNPLFTRYWSTTPYRLGDKAVKYSAIPVQSFPNGAAQAPGSGDDFLREAMVDTLARGEVYFDFAVQEQIDPVAMPVEDPGVAWSETASPFRKLATIRILQQVFDTPEQRTFGENLSFNPWHSLPEHRPLGGINRARKIIYNAISVFRHQRNDVPRIEPTSWDIDAGFNGDGSDETTLTEA